MRIENNIPDVKQHTLLESNNQTNSVNVKSYVKTRETNHSEIHASKKVYDKSATGRYRISETFIHFCSRINVVIGTLYRPTFVVPFDTLWPGEKSV